MDDAGNLLSTANHLYIRAASSTDTKQRPPVYKVVGLILAISSGLFIGTSFVLKKTGLLKANIKYNEEAGEGYGYLKNLYWWSGMTLMIIGEICNFVAYAFVDAILVTPLGALSVVITTILSAIFLKERLSFVGKVGCFNCIIGSVVIVVNAPVQSAVATIQDMKHYVIAPGFLSYAGVVIVGCIFIALWAGPRYGKKSMLVYLSICSLIGGLSVVATQGLGAAIVAQVGGTPQFNQWFLYVLLVFVIATLVTEIIYLNKALNLFNAALVTPTYYVFFTSSTIVTSAILFRGFHGTPASIATVIMGFLQICAGVVLLQLSKSAKDVPDAAVFKGDLDQVRTVAEQEEPESEPKADTMRGTAALLRGISVSRKKREVAEAKRIHGERMEPIAENEHVEWDGLRRRKTILKPGQTGLKRTKTLHPPLGMTHFPDEHEERQRQSIDDESGPLKLFPSFRRRTKTGFDSAQSQKSGSGGPQASPFGLPAYPVALTEISANSKAADARPPLSSNPSSESVIRSTHIYGLPPGLQRPPGSSHLQEDTSYISPSLSAHPGHLQWASSVGDQDRVKPEESKSNQLAPDPPAHAAKRQFSFQNVFHRHRGEPKTERPTSRGTLSSLRKSTATSLDGTTEEERLGLVKGDSTNILGQPDYGEVPQYESEPEELGHDGWTMASGSVRTESPEYVRSPPIRSPPIREERDEDNYMSTPRQPVSQMPRTLPAFPFEAGRRSEDESTATDDDDVDDKPKYDRIRTRDNRSPGSDGGAFV